MFNSWSASLLMHRQHSCREPIINISYYLWRHRIVDIRSQGAIRYNLWKFHRDRLSRLREKYYQHVCDNNNNADIPRGFALHIRFLPRHKNITITSVTFHQLNHKLMSARRSKFEGEDYGHRIFVSPMQPYFFRTVFEIPCDNIRPNTSSHRRTTEPHAYAYIVHETCIVAPLASHHTKVGADFFKRLSGYLLSYRLWLSSEETRKQCWKQIPCLDPFT